MKYFKFIHAIVQTACFFLFNRVTEEVVKTTEENNNLLQHLIQITTSLYIDSFIYVSQLQKTFSLALKSCFFMWLGNNILYLTCSSFCF